MGDSGSETRRTLAALGATLFFIGMVTGIFSAFALSGKIAVGDSHLALAAHINALLGGLWMVLVAWTFELLSYGEKGKRALAWFVGLPAYGNWAVTLVASFVGAKGISFDPPMKNQVIAGLLQAFVVLPTLVGAGMWAWGFRRR